MRVRRFPTKRAQNLTPGVTDVLVGGWGGPSSGKPDDDPFAVFELSDAQLRALGRTHRAELETEAKRRGLARPWIATVMEGI